MKPFGEIHLDGARALKVTAAVGLAVLGISVIPGLLRAPEPEPLPADVGFRPTENLDPAPSVALPLQAQSRGPADGTKPERKKGRRDGRTGRPDRSEARPRPERRGGGRGGKRQDGPGGSRPGRKPAPEPLVAPPPPAPAAPPPAATWSPPPPQPTPVDDGSVEFAPRLGPGKRDRRRVRPRRRPLRCRPSARRSSLRVFW